MSEEINHSTGDKPAVPSNPLLASAIGLLRIARCPDCEGEGWYVREVGVWYWSNPGHHAPTPNAF